MALATFTPPKAPSVGASAEPKIKLFEAEFGDGYTQRSAAGLNHIRESWELKFELLTAAESAAIRTFLQARGGVEAFLYTPPGEATPIRVTCKKWKRTFDEADRQTITLTIEQDFGLAS
ncbi:phage tail protein [Methylopila sp. 73B]|uniref:phage tail protein n=1 Tax=Methylopila sp. 73B TaxID=1120792 RepID=UPI00035FE591|nr:phage tail protein [Methylopila sp. 73B]